MNFLRGAFNLIFGTEKNAPSTLPLLEKPWREDIFQNIQDVAEIRNKVIEFATDRRDVERVNILMIGEVGSGKTSFYNNCITAVGNNGIKSPFLSRTGVSGSVTVKLQKTDIRIGITDKFINVNLYDCQGLSNFEGLREEDVHKLIEGKIKENYPFDAEQSIQVEDNIFFNPTPSLGDRMHCIVYAVNANNPTDMIFGETARKIMSAVLKKYGRQNIAQMVLMNRTDNIRASIRDEPKEIFYSQEVRDKVRLYKSIFGVNLNNILPMMNYTEEMSPTKEIDVLTLYNLYTIMSRAKDYLHYIADHPEENA